MAEGYSILVDTSKCTACRGCQISCKQWNQLPGTQTQNVGTYENPKDLSSDTYKVVRFAGRGQWQRQAVLALFHGAVPALPIAWMHGSSRK